MHMQINKLSRIWLIQNRKVKWFSQRVNRSISRLVFQNEPKSILSEKSRFNANENVCENLAGNLNKVDPSAATDTTTTGNV